MGVHPKRLSATPSLPADNSRHLIGLQAADNDLIVKPCGHELRVYDERWLDVCRLAIEPGKGTSLHAHARKHTWLICIGGEAVLSTPPGKEIALVERSVVHICPGALHATFTEQGVRFSLESASQAWRSPHDLVVAVALDTSSVLRHELIMLGHDATRTPCARQSQPDGRSRPPARLPSPPSTANYRARRFGCLDGASLSTS